ncbi:GNAT family N-acetyltransferase [Nocardia sp. NPDC020380]|uniref:GNAT family N-acetyltransferase n=1 Tax=Nocardia sp. NPDC020380 TaxID=3364309 RepID=UPI0037B4229D
MPRAAPALVAAEMFTRAQPVIPLGDGLVLRAWLRRDAPEVFAAAQDPAIRRWHTLGADTEDEAEDRVDAWARAWSSGTDANWAIADSHTGRIAGRAALRSIHPVHGLAEVAYWVVPAVRGRGIAPRAVQALIGWAFDIAGFHRLDLRHSVYNTQSCRVATKCDFALEGVNRSAWLHDDGWHDMHMHARINDGGPAATTAPIVRARPRHRAGD